jgi:hypothetical protein
MSIFRNLSNKLFGDAPHPIRPIKDVLPNGTLTDKEVSYYLAEGKDIEQTRTITWLHDVKFIKFLFFKIKKYPNLEESITDAYNDAVIEVCIDIKTKVYRAQSSLNTYFCSIFDNKVVNIFRKKATIKAKEEGQLWYASRDATIEDLCRDTGISAIEPEDFAELLNLFQQTLPKAVDGKLNQADWIRYAILGWKEDDFVNGGFATSLGSAKSYVSQCKKAFMQFLNDNGYHLKKRKDKKETSKPLDMSVKILILVAFNGLRGLLGF